MRILTVISGVLLIFTSVWCFAHPGVSFLALAFILGIAMLIQGLFTMLGYLSLRRGGERAGWVLAEGIVTVALSVIVLSNQLVSDAVIPVFFGMWVLFSGAMRIPAALTERSKGEREWIVSLILGLLGVLLGLYCFYNPLLIALAFGVLVGFTFLLQGINMLTFGIFMLKTGEQYKQ